MSKSTFSFLLIEECILTCLKRPPVNTDYRRTPYIPVRNLCEDTGM